MVIYFTRDFCLPCQVMKPWIDELRREQLAAVDVVVVNVDRGDNHRFANHFRIEEVPTQVFVSAAGRIEMRNDGVATKEQMLATLRRLGWTR